MNVTPLQANLGLRRAKQCEDFLALASWLAMKEPGLTTSIMKSQLSRLYGQLYAFQVCPGRGSWRRGVGWGGVGWVMSTQNVTQAGVGACGWGMGAGRGRNGHGVME